MSQEDHVIAFDLIYPEPPPPKLPGARAKIRAFLEEKVGHVVTTDQIGRIAGIHDYQRRIRELRNEEGMQICSHVDEASLKPGEYLLKSLERLSVAKHAVSPQARVRALEHFGSTCRLCGASAGDIDPYSPGRTVRLHVEQSTANGLDMTAGRVDLCVLCSICGRGKRNSHPPTESSLDILAHIRKQPRTVQKEIYRALKQSLGDT